MSTNLVFLGTWQILPIRRAYMRARKRFGIAVSVVSATLGRRQSTYRAAASSSTSRSLLLQLVADDAGRRRPLRAPDRQLHPCEADGVAVRHCLRRPPARRGAPLSDPPPPKLDPKIGSPSLREALPPVLPRRRGLSPPDFGRPCPREAFFSQFAKSKITNFWR